MTEPYLGEIQVFGFSFAPYGWASCNGALLPIQQYSALFSLLGTNYGGDGRTNFMLPNFTARAACNQGQSPGHTRRVAGETFGEQGVTLTQNTMPSHSHAFTVYNQTDTTKQAGSPSLGNALTTPSRSSAFAAAGSPASTFSPIMGGVAGSSLPHENRQPYLAVNFCIALQGVYPSFG